MKRRSMDQQPYRASATEQECPPSGADSGHDQLRFRTWVEQTRSGADVRSRIAVAGNKISTGRFGQLHLLTPDESLNVSFCDQEQSSGLARGTAANDEVFEQPAVSLNRN